MNTVTTATTAAIVTAIRNREREARNARVVELTHIVGRILDNFAAPASRTVSIHDLQRELPDAKRDDLNRAVSRALHTRTSWVRCGPVLVLSRRQSH